MLYDLDAVTLLLIESSFTGHKEVK